MINKTMALSVRALRVDTRLRTSHLLRLGLALIVMMSLIWIQDSNNISAPGLSLFTWIVYTNATLISFLVPLYFANAITEEKEERTLALLLIANVNPATIVFGKALPRLFTVLFVLIVQFPFTLLAITLGGVTLSQIVAAYAALLSYALFVACLSLFCSVMMRLTANAVGAAGLLLLGYHILPGLLYGVSYFMKQERFLPQLADAGIMVANKIWETNVFVKLATALQSTFNDPLLTSQVVSNVVAAAVFFLLSILTFNYFNKEVDSEPVKKKSKSIASLSGAGTSRRSWDRAIVWKEFVFGSGGRAYVIGKLVIYGGLLVAIALLTDINRLEDLGTFISAIMFYCFIPLEITSVVSRLIQPEIKGKTLSTLMLLPMSTREIFYSKLEGGLWGLIPAVSYLILGLLFAPSIVIKMIEALFENPLEFGTIILLFAGQLCLFWHLVAAFSLSMNGWWAICLALLGQWFGSFLVMMFFSMLLFSGNGRDSWMPMSWMGVIMLFAASIALHVWIGKQLHIKAAGD